MSCSTTTHTSTSTSSLRARGPLPPPLAFARAGHLVTEGERLPIHSTSSPPRPRRSSAASRSRIGTTSEAITGGCVGRGCHVQFRRYIQKKIFRRKRYTLAATRRDTLCPLPPTLAKFSSSGPPTGLGCVKTLECEQPKSTGKSLYYIKRYSLAATWLDTSVLLPSGHSPSPPPFFPHPVYLIQVTCRRVPCREARLPYGRGQVRVVWRRSCRELLATGLVCRRSVGLHVDEHDVARRGGLGGWRVVAPTLVRGRGDQKS
eukprot:scaffold14791_cov131-Isochrysis_galbana.AAC.1